MAERSAKTRAILAQRCNRCGAPPGRPCSVVTGRAERIGKPVGYTHRLREYAAARALMAAAGAGGSGA